MSKQATQKPSTPLLPAEMIKRKRSGHSHSKDELRDWIESFVAGRLPDYQMAAWLMAVYFKGMSDAETATFTEIMRDSGRVLDFSNLPGVAVDKHSTGGVGDKASLILAPIVAAAGVRVPMIAGRGLGHTGGTLDKLEAIPGFRVDRTLDQFVEQVSNFGLSIIGQTDEICPSDKKMYALRDVTATVESDPLICASIMSKKLAEGIGALVLDIKFGSGAFMKTAEQAEVLARKLMAIGHAHGKGVVSWITNMDQPLGRFIGNAVEIGECVAILKNERYWGHSADEFDDTRELSLRLAAEMIYLGRQTPSAEAGYARAKELLASGAAWSKFESLCRLQGGELEKLSEPHVVCTVAAPSDGCVSTYATEAIGIAAITIGAGRAKASDVIDPSAGIFVHKKLGESVVRGEPLFTLFGNPHANSQVGSPVGSKVDSPIAAQMIDDRFEQASEMLLAATTISLQKSRVPDLMTKRIELL